MKYCLPLAAACCLLMSNSAVAQPQKEIDKKLASELVYCSALAYGGVETTENDEKRKQWLSIASNFFTAASRLATEQELSDFKPAAMERREKLFAALEKTEKEAGSPENPLALDLKHCVALMRDNAPRIKELAPAKRGASPDSPITPRLYKPEMNKGSELKPVVDLPFMQHPGQDGHSGHRRVFQYANDA